MSSAFRLSNTREPVTREFNRFIPDNAELSYDDCILTEIYYSKTRDYFNFGFSNGVISEYKTNNDVMEIAKID